MLVEKALKEHRNQLIREMWLVFRNLSDVQSVEEFTDEDLKLWTAITEHSAIQGRLEIKSKPTNTQDNTNERD